MNLRNGRAATAKGSGPTSMSRRGTATPQLGGK